MQKEFEHQEKLRNLDEEKRKAEEKAWEESQKKHKEHPKVNLQNLFNFKICW